MPNIDWESSVSIGNLRHDMFIDFCCQHNLRQYVLMPTRKSLVLEIVLSNDHDTVSNLEVCQSLANCDHCTVRFDIGIFACQEQVKYCPKSYNLIRANFVEIFLTFKVVDWHLFLLVVVILMNFG